ncbi:hypothetical protein [Streptomyces sp. NPDC003952]
MTTTMRRVGVIVAVAVLAVVAAGALTLGILANVGGPSDAGPSASEGDRAACKAAMSESSTGIVQWNADKSTRPAACRGLDEATFQEVASEWFVEFYKQLGKTAEGK